MNILRYTKTIDWIAMWEMYTKSIIATMYKNMAADIDCGYNPFGTSIRQQRENIAAYEKEYSETLEKFRTMTDEEINHYCFYDLKARGAIE